MNDSILRQKIEMLRRELYQERLTRREFVDAQQRTITELRRRVQCLEAALALGREPVPRAEVKQ